MRNVKFRVISFILVFILSFPLSTLKVQAVIDNGTDSSSGTASGRYAGGPTYSRTGWLMYLVETDSDTVVSDVVMVSCGGTPQGGMRLATRIGNMQPSRIFAGVPWASDISPNGAPFTNGQASNGSRIIQWMLKDGGHGEENWFNVVTQYWTREKALDMSTKGWSLIMEPFYWANIGKGWFCGNAKGWGQYMSSIWGPDNYGPRKFALFTNGIFGHCAKFEKGKWCWGLEPYVGGQRVTNSDMEYYALGIMSITPFPSGQTTCDEPLIPTPHQAPDESHLDDGKTIIKNYRTKNLTTGEETDDGCFIKKDVVPKITIEDETEYSVIEWKTSSNESSIDSITWPVPGSITQTGTSVGTVELKERPEKVLYVLLERVIEEEEELIPDIDYFINQSQISRHVTISEALTNPDAMEIAVTEFNFKWPELQKECPGHPYTEKDWGIVKGGGLFFICPASPILLYGSGASKQPS